MEYKYCHLIMPEKAKIQNMDCYISKTVYKGLADEINMLPINNA
jgi:hypothetical protein